MPRDSQQIPGHEQKLTGTSASGSAPEAADSGVGPGVGVEDLALLSRTGSTSHRGKLDSELPRVRCHSETVALLQLRAAEHGIPLSEFIRISLECLIYGTEAVANSEADRIRRVGLLVGGSAAQGERR